MVAIAARSLLKIYQTGFSTEWRSYHRLGQCGRIDLLWATVAGKSNMTPIVDDKSEHAPAIWIVEPLDSDERIWQSVLKISEFRRVKISTSADRLARQDAMQVGAVIVASSASEDDIRSVHDTLQARGQAAPVVRWDPAMVEELRVRLKDSVP